MNLLRFILPVLVLSASCAFSQPIYQWSQSIISSTSAVNGIGTDAAGNVYSTGFFSGTYDFDYGPGTQTLTMTNGFYVSKRTAAGDLIWVKGIDPTSVVGYPTALGMDQSGNVVVTGYFSGPADFDPGAGNTTLTPNGDDDIFVLKLDYNGNFLWVKQYGGTLEDQPEKLAIDNNGNIYINGHFNNVVNFGTATYTSNGSSDICLIKIDPNGTTLWAQKIGSTSADVGTGIAVDVNGDVYSTGYFQQTCDFNPGAGVFNLSSSGSYDVYVLKLNTAGVFQWAKRFTGISNNRGMGINVDLNGNVYASGFFNLTCDFDPGPGTLNFTSVGSSPDGFLVKLDNSGSLIWAKQFDGEIDNTIIVQQVKTDAVGDIYASVEFSGTLDFDPNAGVQNISSSFCCDVSLLKLDANGNFQWVLPFMGSSSNIKHIYDFNINSTGSVAYVGGTFNTSVDVDPGPGTVNLTSPSAANAFFVKLATCVASPPVPTSASLSDLTGTCSVNAPTAPTASNCNGTFNGSANVTFPITTQGTTVVTWTYDDGNGNTSTQTQNVIINDVTPPVVPTLANVTGACSATVTAPTTTDNCAGTITGTTTDPLTYSAQGTYTINWTFDDGNGNTSTQTQNVIIDDVTPPVVPTLANVTGACSATVTAPTTTDNCAGTITGTTTDPLTYSAQGTYTINWTFDDGNGNTSTATQTVIVDDVTPPVVPTLANVTEACSATVTAPTATDNCAGTITGTTTDPLTYSAQGTYTINWTFDDGNGNTSTATQTVIVDDITAPVPDSPILTISTNCPVTTLAPLTATDNCAGTITGTTTTTFPITALGTTVVVWTFDDGNGNVSTQNQPVTITAIDNSTSVTAIGSAFEISANASFGFTYQWIENCGTSNTLIPNATNQTYIPTTNGSYAVIISNGTCSDTSDCVIIDELGLNALEQSKYVLAYPNPSSGIVRIRTQEQMIGVDVLNTLGQIISSEKVDKTTEMQLILPEIPGMYLLRIRWEDTSQIIQIIKQ